MFLFLVLVIALVSMVIRLIMAPFRYRSRRPFFGYGSMYDNPYRYGCRRHHRLLGSVLPILALVALDRIFNRRYW